jgi:hypothetical protein
MRAQFAPVVRNTTEPSLPFSHRHAHGRTTTWLRYYNVHTLISLFNMFLLTGKQLKNAHFVQVDFMRADATSQLSPSTWRCTCCGYLGT